MNIKITYDSNNILNQNDLNITFNEKIIDNVKILDSIIEFDLDTNHGYHMLKMSVRQPLFIKDLKIDNNSIRELLYLSFLLEENKKLQPRTDIQNSSQVWCMPIIYPLSSFFSFIQNNIPNGYLGKNLFDYFDMFFPESVTISSRHPKILQDYFLYDSNFSIIPKSVILNNNKMKKAFDETNFYHDQEKILNEIKKNLPLIDFNLDRPHQYVVNNNEFNVKDPWKKSYFIKRLDKTFDIGNPSKASWKERFAWKPQEWPYLFELLESLQLQNIIQGWLAELPPNAFIFPHNDNTNQKYFENDNSSVMYIPLCSPENVFFKFANFGLVNLNKISLIDNKRFSHAVVNDSSLSRYILNITFSADY
jgi:hypothetical protein